MLQTNSREIDLFGRTLLISERIARDVNKLILFSKQKKEKDFTDFIVEYSIVVADALKINYSNLKWYQFFKKKKLERLLSKESLLEKLSPSQIYELAMTVYELEGVTDKKKAETEKEPG